MTRILALDAATQACSVALKIDDQIEERFEVASRSHAQRLLPMIEALLSEAGIAMASLDCIAFGRGPGSFTGLRIAAGVVQGLAFGADLPVAPVSTLQTIAQSAVGSSDYERALVVLNAHMGEIYWANYEISSTNAQLVGEEMLSGSHQLSLPYAEQLLPGMPAVLGLGSGWELRDSFPATLVNSMVKIDSQRLPHACDMLPFAQMQLEQESLVAAEFALPVYLREKNAWRKSV